MDFYSEDLHTYFKFNNLNRIYKAQFQFRIFKMPKAAKQKLQNNSKIHKKITNSHNTILTFNYYAIAYVTMFFLIFWFSQSFPIWFLL